MKDLPQYSLDGKVALVTGASRGIGQAAALLLARAGADVAVVSRSQDELERVARSIRDLGQRSIAVAGHLGRMEQLEPIIEQVVAELGGLDVLVNNAGTNFFSPAIDMDERGWDAVMNLDLKGLFFLSQAAARHMRDHGGGTIVNVSSLAGMDVQANTGHYSVAKAGVIMATKVMAFEWAQYGVRANCVAPGAVNTKLFSSIFSGLPPEQAEAAIGSLADATPLGRVGEPSEIADAILYLSSQASSYMTGQTFAVDGGASLLAAVNSIGLPTDG
jgi:NAD(P)-dependent dehydrogenase (short-subunit alcohol dehydrogenase family)